MARMIEKSMYWVGVGALWVVALLAGCASFDEQVLSVFAPAEWLGASVFLGGQEVAELSEMDNDSGLMGALLGAMGVESPLQGFVAVSFHLGGWQLEDGRYGLVVIHPEGARQSLEFQYPFRDEATHCMVFVNESEAIAGDECGVEGDEPRSGPALEVEFRRAQRVEAGVPAALAGPDGSHYLLSGEPFVEARDIVEATVEAQAAGSGPGAEAEACVVRIWLSSERQSLRAEATADGFGEPIAVLVAGEVVTVAGLGGPIGDSVVIDGQPSCEAAEELATALTP